MKTTIKKPKIKSFKQFKECVRSGEIEYGFGRTVKNFTLHYGFGQEIELKGAKNLRDAYKNYKNSFYYYDQYVSPNSFLNHKNIE